MRGHAWRDTEDPDEVVTDPHEAARRRVRARRQFSSDVVAYVVVNVVLVVIWALSGAGYFWPAWVIALWGVVLLLHAWRTLWRRPMTEDDIEAEMQRHHN